MTNIKTKRKQLGLTQAKLAKRAGVSQGSVERAESEKYTIGEATLIKILQALDIPVAEYSAEGQANVFRPDELKAHRERLGLSMRELARMAGLTDNTIKNAEAGGINPTPYTRKCIDEALQRAEKKDHSDRHKKPETAEKPDDRLTNGDILRRRIISNSDLINAGLVSCHRDPSTCANHCMQCKHDYLNRPYTKRGE